MLKGFLSNSFETSSETSDKRLLTHFYNNTYEEVKNEFLAVMKMYGFKVVNIDDTYCEILVEMPHGEFVVTLIKESYYVTSVDFKATTTYLFPCGRGAKYISEFYDNLNKRLSLKQVGGSYHA